MARSLSNAKNLSTFVADRVSLLVARKGYAVGAAEGGGKVGVAQSNMMMMKMKGIGEESAPKSLWVPDPVTGYYRPENQENQIDAVELRRLLLKSKFTGH